MSTAPQKGIGSLWSQGPCGLFAGWRILLSDCPGGFGRSAAGQMTTSNPPGTPNNSKIANPTRGVC
ncbi:hypothetical protein PCANC_20368 [Puccinia coronata f. sp. avenae]|uniref:Uncharacterized protein n=1 Tax=Puccinia coronata f. sp. avenae TaxID=200324 RepID=A0A2N5U1M1_9BASI|nr:hypothetical protein PCANC_20368 [Puccinia coronata f. sp. avenae]